MASEIAISWQLGPNFGWGLFGLQIAFQLKTSGRANPILLSQMRPYNGDPLERAVLHELWAENRAAIKSMHGWSEDNVEVDICVIGNKAASFFASVGGNVVASIKDVGDEPASEDLIGGGKVMLDAYDQGRIDKLYLVSNEFVNTMTQTPTVQQLLPLAPSADDTLSHHWDYIYEPDAVALLDGMLVRYIESQVHQGVVENKACEQAARMLAMKNATENAGELIDELQLLYNKARQAAITQELSEIVSGAAAV